MGWGQYIGAVVTLALGVGALIWPLRVASIVGIAPQGTLGISEVRATYGGLFAAVGAGVLLMNNDLAATLLGIAWAGAALGRAVSMVVDRARGGKNAVGFLFEAGLAALLIMA
jgi:hypothetical protein